MAKLDSLTGRGATRVILSVFEGMRRSVRGEARARRGGRGRKSHDHVSHEGVGVDDMRRKTGRQL